MNESPVVIVLAGGAGSRFSGYGHKLMQPLGESTVLGTTLAQVMASRLPLVVVTSAALQDAVTESVASHDVVIVPEAGPATREVTGMGHSIAAGVRACGQAGGWLVLPGDMPLVTPATLRAVAGALAHHPVAYAQYQGRRGHPVAFAAELYSELATLTGDEGARRIVARYPAAAVEVDDRGVLMDLDTEADLLEVRRLHAESSSLAAAHG